jgi:hypothetical protein
MKTLVHALLWSLTAAFACAIDDVAIEPATKLAADDPAWRDLAAAFAAQPDLVAHFDERRYFPFRKEPLRLAGEVRVSQEHGLSLHYTEPEDRVMIVDAAGVELRPPLANGAAASADPRTGSLANPAFLLDVLRFDVAALQKNFELYGRREQDAWALALVPRDQRMQRALGRIYVRGTGPTVHAIELRRSARQHIDIAITDPRPVRAFSAAERKEFFR